MTVVLGLPAPVMTCCSNRHLLSSHHPSHLNDSSCSESSVIVVLSCITITSKLRWTRHASPSTITDHSSLWKWCDAETTLLERKGWQHIEASTASIVACLRLHVKRRRGTYPQNLHQATTMWHNLTQPNTAAVRLYTSRKYTHSLIHYFMLNPFLTAALTDSPPTR